MEKIIIMIQRLGAPAMSSLRNPKPKPLNPKPLATHHKACYIQAPRGSSNRNPETPTFLALQPLHKLCWIPFGSLIS